MRPYKEEGRFSIQIDLSAEFDEQYEGDEDGYEWLRQWQQVTRPKLIKAVFEALRSDLRFEAISAPRGGSPDEQLDIEVKLKKDPAATIALKRAKA